MEEPKIIGILIIGRSSIDIPGYVLPEFRLEEQS